MIDQTFIFIAVAIFGFASFYLAILIIIDYPIRSHHIIFSSSYSLAYS